MGQVSPHRSQLVNRYKQGDRDFSGIDLHQVDLSRIQLFQADLSQANLFNTNLIGADLRQVNLSQANLSQANLQNADLQGANLTGANLRRANLAGADIRDTQLQQAHLTGAVMPDGKLYSGSIIPLAGSQPLPAEAIQQDLQKIAKPKPQPKPILPPIVRSAEQIRADLPYIPLMSLSVGFFLTGIQMAAMRASAPLYLILPLTLTLCYFYPDAAWFIPVVIVGILLSSLGIGQMMIFPALIFLLILGLVKVFGRNIFRDQWRGSLWIAGVLMVGMVLYGLLLNAPLIMLLVLATILATGFGAVVPSDMATRRFRPQEILLVTQGVAIVSLIMGATIGSFLYYAKL
jgi:uncharacterized protein YjbI with pentapeptide repeats